MVLGEEKFKLFVCLFFLFLILCHSLPLASKKFNYSGVLSLILKQLMLMTDCLLCFLCFSPFFIFCPLCILTPFFLLMFDCLVKLGWNKSVMVYNSCFFFFFLLEWLEVDFVTLWNFCFLVKFAGWKLTGLGFIIHRVGGGFESYSILHIPKRITTKFLRWPLIRAEAQHGLRGFEAVNGHLIVMHLIQGTVVLTGRLSPWFNSYSRLVCTYCYSWHFSCIVPVC